MTVIDQGHKCKFYYLNWKGLDLDKNALHFFFTYLKK